MPARQGEGLASHFGHHRHIALVYDRYGDQHAVASDFIRNGLDQNGFCLYLHDETPYQAVLDLLAEAGIDHETEVAAGRLVIGDRTRYLDPDGAFSSTLMLETLRNTVEIAVANGYRGLFATGEMSWALGAHPGVAELMPYESLCNELIQGHEVVGLCQYNRRRFSDRALQQVLLTHPWILIGGRVCRNLYHVPLADLDFDHFPEHASVDELLDDIVARDALERTLTEATYSIEGSLEIGAGRDDSRQMVKIYSDLVVFKEGLLHRAESRHKGTTAASTARSDAAAAVSMLRGELLAMQQRLEYWQDQLRRMVGMDYDPERRTVHYAGRSVKLSRRESQLVAALLTQNGRPLAVRDLLHRAWGGNNLSEAQLRSYVVMLRKKLALLEMPAALVNEPGVGYSLRFDPVTAAEPPQLSVVRAG